MTDVLLLADIPSTGYLVGTAAERVSGTARANEETGRFLAFLGQRLQTSEAVVALYPSWQAASAKRLLKLARTVLNTDSIAQVSLNLPPLALSLVADQIAYLAPYLQPGHLASVAHSLAASMSAGAWTRSVTKLEHIDTKMGDHLASYLPNETFVVAAAPRPGIHRIAGRKVPDLGFRPAEPIHLLITQGDVTWFQESMQSALRPGAVKVVPAQPLGLKFWGNKRYIEFVAFSGHPSALSEIANATRCWLCRWCGQQTALPVCSFCNMAQAGQQPAATPAPAPRAALPAPSGASDPQGGHAAAAQPPSPEPAPAPPMAPEPAGAAGHGPVAGRGGQVPPAVPPAVPGVPPQAVPPQGVPPEPAVPPALSHDPGMPPGLPPDPAMPPAAHPSQPAPPYAPAANAGPPMPAPPDPRQAPDVPLPRPAAPPGVSPRAVQPNDQHVAGSPSDAGPRPPHQPQFTQTPPGLRLVQDEQAPPAPPQQPQPTAAEPAPRHRSPYPSQPAGQPTRTSPPLMPVNPHTPQTPRQAAQQLRGDPNWNGRSTGTSGAQAQTGVSQVPPGQISSQYPSAVDTVRGATSALGPDQSPNQSAGNDHDWTQRNPGQLSPRSNQPNGHPPDRVSP